jgi:sarcosine oxidase subunit beta
VVDVAIIGAGITGLSIALHLRERTDAEIVVFDRAGVGAGASGVQPGGVRQQWGTRVNCLMARESLRFYRELVPRLEARVDPGFRPCGYLFLAHSEAALDRVRANVRLQNEVGVSSSVLGPAEAEAIVPGLDPSTIVGASFCAEDGFFDRPQSVVEAFAEAVVRRGVRIERADVALRSLRADVVVVAAGADTPALVPGLPIEPEPRRLFFSDPVGERLLEPLVVSLDRSFAAKQLADGRLLASDLAAGERAGVRATMQALLPRLEYVSLPHVVEGVYDVTPDRQAMLGAVPGHDGLFVAAGFSGHGFMMAPEVGRLVAGAVLGDEPEEALRDLSPERFALGRPIPEPAVV